MLLAISTSAEIEATGGLGVREFEQTGVAAVSTARWFCVDFLGLLRQQLGAHTSPCGVTAPQHFRKGDKRARRERESHANNRILANSTQKKCDATEPSHDTKRGMS